jgi:uncharacterized membrane protein
MTRLLLASLALAFACGGRSEAEPTPPGRVRADPDDTRADLLAAETAAFERARPVFDRHCARCHARGGDNPRPEALEHCDMSSYPFRGHHAGEIAAEIRTVLAIGGGKPTMPADQPGAVTGDELALIAAWADAFEKSHAAGAHEGHGHGGEHDHGAHEHQDGS